MGNNSETDIVAATDVEMEQLCTASVELIHYARNITAKQVNIIQIMTSHVNFKFFNMLFYLLR